MLRSALASICTSTLAAAVVCAGEAPPDPARVATAEIEAKVARKPDVYLLLDPPRRVLEIKARGVTLDSIPLAGIEIASQQPLLGGDELPLPDLPAVWQVVEGPGDTDREVIAPTSLRPYSAEDEEDEEPPATPAPRATRAPTPTPVPEPPTSYRSRLDRGWDIWITDRLPASGLFGRYRAAVRDGWARLFGKSVRYRPALTLAMSRGDAQRLHHLMRKGTEVVIAAGAP